MERSCPMACRYTRLNCVLAAIALTTTAILVSSAPRAAEVTVPRQILAFFYGWYRNPTVSGVWHGWVKPRPAEKEIASSLHYPEWGPYDSNDPKIIERQATEAENAGLTGFIYSWWGRDNIQNAPLKLMLDVADRHHLKVTIYIEKVEGDTEKDKEANGAADLRFILDTYATHPAFLKVGAHPVMFAYVRAINKGPRNWASVISAVSEDPTRRPLIFADSNARTSPSELLNEFYGLHRYGITRETAGLSREQLAAWGASSYPAYVAEAEDRISCVTISPGHDVSKIKKRPDPTATDRIGGEAYRILWQQAIAANPDWILINSWNEWHEGSELEPSAEFDHQALDDTKTYAKQFLALPPKTHPIP
jgi:glycoprotein endo-alpha-1,2-mannosidase